MNDQEQNEVAEIKKEIEQIRADYNGAKKILQDINSFRDNFQTLRVFLSDENTGIQATYNFTKIQKEQIDTLVVQAQDNSNAIVANLQKVEANIASMQAAYSEFTETKGKISGIGGEIGTLLNTSRGLHDDISAAKKEALSTLESTKNIYQAVTENIKDMQAAYQEFLQIRSKIDDGKTGLQVIFETVQILNKQSNALFTEIKAFRDSAKEFLSEIEQNKHQSNKLKTDIQSSFEYTVLKKAEIEKATGLIIDTSFSETFKRRQDEIEEGLYSWHSWKYIFLGSVLLLVILVILPFTGWLDFGDLTWYKLFLSRIYYTSPVLFLITFSAIQYSKERDLAEKYAFKAASSAAIRSHVDYLIEKFKKDDEDKVLDFAKDTFSTIYKEPYTVHDNLEKRIKQLEKNQNIGNNNLINIDEIVKGVKELKELVPEAGIFEKVLSIFIKK